MSKLRKKIWSINSLILIVLVIAGAYFRFANTPQRYGFDPDPPRDGVIAKYALETFQIPLSGPPSGIAPFSFGPWYYYQIIAAEALLPVDYAPWVYLGIASLVYILVMYEIGKKLKNNSVGLILAFFAALSPALTGPSAGLSNPNFIPLFAALFIFIALKYMRKETTPWWILAWGGVFGIGVSHHYQMGGLILLPLAALILNREKNISTVLFFAAGVILVSIPSIIFELQNNWHNTNGIWFYITQARHGIYIPNSWRIYIFDFWIPFFSYIQGVPQILGIALGFVFTATHIWAIYKRIINAQYLILMGVLLANIVMLRYVSVQREYYYFLFTVPFVTIFIGYSLHLLTKAPYLRYLPLLIIASLIPFLFQEDMARLGTRQEFIDYKNIAMFLRQKYPKQKFMFYDCKKPLINKVYALNYFLMKEDMLGEDGVKIGFYFHMKEDMLGEDKVKIDFSSEGCMQRKGQKVAGKAKKVPNINAFILNDLSETELTQNGWQKVTPQTMYEDTVTVQR